MFKKTPSEKTGLENAIDKLFEDMSNVSPDSKEFTEMMTNMDKLYKLKEVDQKITSGRRVSPDTWAIVGANVLGILMIVGHERANVVTSKAITLLSKLR